MDLGLEAPVGLAALAAIAPLVWLYLRLRRRPPQLVSSLVLWRSIPEAKLVKRRPRPPLLFLIQVLLIVALGLALARPFSLLPAPASLPPDAVIVLDVSASMQALEAGKTRFSEARAAAEELIGELGRATPSRRFSIIAAGLHPRVVGTGLTADDAEATLGMLETVDTGGNPTAAVELATSQVGATGTVHLFSDAPPESLVLSRDARAVTTVHRFGTSDNNAAIVGVRVPDNRFEEQSSTRVLVTVKNFSVDHRSAVVELTPLDAGPGATSPRQEVLLEPRDGQVVSFEGIAWSGPFQVTLGPADDLPLDNVAYGFIPPHEPLRVLLVTDEPAHAHEIDDLARRLGNLLVSVVSPAAYRPAIATEVTLFDRFVPPLPPPGNVAYLAPRQGNSDIAIVGTTSDTRFAEVRDHELLAGVQNPQTLLSGNLVGLASGGPLKPVLLGRAEGNEAALVLAGTIGERRVVATAFPLRVRSRDADQLPSLIFTLNLLRWLAPPVKDAPLEHLAGDTMPARFPDATSIVRIEGPGQARSFGPSEDVSLEHAGVYRVFGADTSRALLVNFVDPVESDIGRPAFTEVPAVSPPPDARPSVSLATPRVRASHVREVLLVVIAIMLAEWLWLAWLGRPRLGSGHAR